MWGPPGGQGLGRGGSEEAMHRPGMPQRSMVKINEKCMFSPMITVG